MRCPGDASQLTVIDRGGVELEFCPDCRGVWLERDELDKILDTAEAGSMQYSLAYGNNLTRRRESLISTLFDF